MTAAAKVFGKRLDNFMSAPDTQEYITQFTKFLESNSLKFSELKTVPKEVEATQGRYGGTWAHPKLAVFFARWLDISFAVWCDMVIDDLLNKKVVLSIQKP